MASKKNSRKGLRKALSRKCKQQKSGRVARESRFLSIGTHAAAEVLFLVFLQNSRFIEFASSVSNLSGSRRPNRIYTYVRARAGQKTKRGSRLDVCLRADGWQRKKLPKVHLRKRCDLIFTLMQSKASWSWRIAILPQHFSTSMTHFSFCFSARSAADANYGPCTLDPVFFFPFPLIPSSAGHESLMRPINKAKSAPYNLNAAQLTTASAFSLGGRCSDALATLKHERN
jgi:hypothetical protein